MIRLADAAGGRGRREHSPAPPPAPAAPSRAPEGPPPAEPPAPVPPPADKFTWEPFGCLRLQYVAAQNDPEVLFVGRDDGFELQNARIGVRGALLGRAAFVLSIDGALDEREPIDFSVAGAIIALDTELRARGDEASPGWVYVANQLPAMDTRSGFQLAVADDAANQLLGSFWAARGMDLAIDLANGPYGQLGTLFNRVELSAKVPPHVDASGDALVLTIGDFLGTFQQTGYVIVDGTVQ